MNVTSAVIQLDCTDNDIDKNYETVKQYLQQAAVSGVNVAVFPELSDLGYYLKKYTKCAESPWQRYSSELQQIASDYSMSIFIGGCESENGKIFNTLFSISPEKGLQPIYRKNALFGDEQRVFTHGTKPSIYQYHNINIGCHICFDLRFPELFYYAGLQQPEIQIIVAAWPKTRIEQWKKLISARAIENQCFILASNRVGEDNGIVFGGNSLIVSPYGEIISEASLSFEDMIIAKIDCEECLNFRQQIPTANLRNEIYSNR